MMQLALLLQKIVLVPRDANREIGRLALDSRKVLKNDLFIALSGVHFDGRAYIEAAISKGAAAILVEAETEKNEIIWQKNTPIIPIYLLQQKLGEIAAKFYSEPAQSLKIIGVTGTSGKTSCTHFIAQMLQAAHCPSGLIGTLGSGLYGCLGEAGLTTPDAITLQATLRELANGGAKAVAMEVSSHSIHQGRINHIPFDIGIFTNLSQDHLDYHGNMETYAGVKRHFLADFPIKQLIINADDNYGFKWINEWAREKPIIAYSTTPIKNLSAPVLCVFAKKTSLTLQGIIAEIETPWGSGELSLPLIGEFNLSNSLAVLSALCHFGIPFAEVLKLLTTLKPVPGRMQMLGGQGKPVIVVDYAHKPDALEKVLQALRQHAEGDLLCVFGCGGDRDQGKRPIMARIAEQLADHIIITNDNPRHEKPEDISAQILSGFIHPEAVEIELDRSHAIKKSIQLAKEKDCVLIAGKGAERYQQIGDQKLPFDDVEFVTKYLASLA